MGTLRSGAPTHAIDVTTRPITQQATQRAVRPAEPLDDELAAAFDQVAQLRVALASRATIDQAKGVVMAHYQVSADRAFDLLSRWSQYSNVKVRVLAEGLVAAAAGGTLLEEWAKLDRKRHPHPGEGLRGGFR